MKTQLKKNEIVILTVKKHWFVLIKPMLWTLLVIFGAVAMATFFAEFRNFFFIGAGLAILRYIYFIIDRNTNLWTVTNLRIIYEYGVFSNNSKETPLDMINNVSYQQPFIGRLFNFGNVQIQSAAESGYTIQMMVERPKDLKDTITQYQEYYKQRQIRKQALSFANAMGQQKFHSKTDIAEELKKLFLLKEKGIITEEDFQKRKEKILNY